MPNGSNQLIEYGVFYVFRPTGSGGAHIIPVESIPFSSTFAEAERKLLDQLHLPRTRQSPVGLSQSTLTILPLYRLDTADPFVQ